MNTNTLFAILLIAAIIYAANQTPKTPAAEDNTPSPPDYTSLIDAGITVTGRDVYQTGVSLKNEDVRVIRMNSEKKDLGYFSLAGTAISITPKVDYKLYYFMNTSPSTNYYVDLQDYTGKEQDAVDNIFGEGCAIDSSPTFWVRNSGENTQTATSNAQSLAASTSADITIFIKAGWKQCYGMPDAQVLNKENAVCFLYNSTPFSSVETNTGYVSTPSTITNSGNATLKSVKCYKFPVIANTETVAIPVTLTASSTEPTSAHNITVMSEDICLSINDDDLGENWGYVDEDSNSICAPPVKLGTIYIS